MVKIVNRARDAETCEDTSGNIPSVFAGDVSDRSQQRLALQNSVKMMNDPLASVLSNVLNSEQTGKRVVRAKPVSKTIQEVLKKMTALHYLGEVSVEEDQRGGILNINLIGNINKCGAIKPRHAVGKEGFEKFEKRFLPAKDFGVLIVSTPQGIMTHAEAKKKGIGGRLLAYCY